MKCQFVLPRIRRIRVQTVYEHGPAASKLAEQELVGQALS